MKGKYITNNIRLACMSTSIAAKSIHQQLEETIAERRKIMQQLESLSRAARVIDIYLEKAA